MAFLMWCLNASLQEPAIRYIKHWGFSATRTAFFFSTAHRSKDTLSGVTVGDATLITNIFLAFLN